MVHAVAAAAGGQASFIAAWQQRRKGRQPKQYNQPDGESAPHLSLMVHEL